MKRIAVLFTLLSIIVASQAQEEKDFYAKLSDAAISIVDPRIKYDPAYTRISYPNGDVAADRGVCTDVIIRAYRKLGIDLQKEVHEDMKANFNLYPNKRMWGLKSTDRNIDHRRVPNLQIFFTRKGEALTVTKEASDYKPGDIVTWDLGGGVAHIGVVINQKTLIGTPLVVHNYGTGQIRENILFQYKITGHYRYKK